MIIHADCLEHLRTMDSDSIDSMVTDPPAGISFMGKEWDKSDGFIPFMTNVMKEALRVLKPGAHAFVWAIPRTSHWTATALENAGFEIRDVVTHLFGSGFPKSHDISKAIDKAAGAEREVIGPNPNGIGRKGSNTGRVAGYSQSESQGKSYADSSFITAPSTPEAKQWQGFGTALKPASEHWILCRKPCSEKTVSANVLKHGTGGINVDQTRIAGKLEGDPNRFSKAYSMGDGHEGWKRPSHETNAPPVVRTEGRFPANLILSHNEDCGTKPHKNEAPITQHGGFKETENRPYFNHASEDGTETVAAFECTDGCAVTGLNIQAQQEVNRYFYCAKASKRERNEGCEGLPEKEKKTLNDYVKPSEGRTASKSGAPASNHHPTVKPIKLMSYLITMITPPNGIVLDPFMGSGSTGVAAVQSGFQFIGIEKELEYFQIAEKRLDHGRNRQEDKDCTVSHSQESSMEGL